MKKKGFIRNLIRVFLLISILLAFGSASAQDNFSLLKEGKEIWIGKDYYFVCTFNKKPQLGTVILKVELYTQDGKRDTSLKIVGNSGMPSMPGHHDSGDMQLQLNKKGDYLLPVNIVMPGDWEVVLTFLKDNKPLFRGSIPFNV